MYCDSVICQTDVVPPADFTYVCATDALFPGGWLIGGKLYSTSPLDLSVGLPVKCAGLHALGHVPELAERIYSFGDFYLAHFPTASKSSVERITEDWTDAFLLELAPLYPARLITGIAEVFETDRTLVRAVREVLASIHAQRVSPTTDVIGRLVQ